VERREIKVNMSNRNNEKDKKNYKLVLPEKAKKGHYLRKVASNKEEHPC